MSEETVVENVEEVAEDNKEGIVTSESSSTVEFVERDLNDEELEEKKLQLMNAKIYKDKTELSLAEMEEQLDAKIPLRFLEDDITKLEKDIEEKTTKDDKGNKIPATENDLEYMKIRLKYLNKSKELDLPMRELRFSLHAQRIAQDRIDSPSKQIAKLEAEIRKGRETTLATRTQDGKKIPIGVN